MHSAEVNCEVNPQPAGFIKGFQTLAERLLLAHLPTPPTQQPVDGVGKPNRWARSPSKIKPAGWGGELVRGVLLLFLKAKTTTATTGATSR